ncbi:pol protein [Cucumis melo var. makuwa]|uniref:Pol protein n=1 Tax=Cucumis melo var. makuwa TaxID=1194695 RepID=A0A5D3DCT9_CUCMM|nr:pol protein [Cucumis melo var. makuwa]TYK21280.1 pol protein [Cucumis melo var. makuwa]
MRQRRWLELVKDYDCEILYHPGKANVLAQLTVQPTLRQKIIIAQSNDPYLVEKRCLAEARQAIEFSISSNAGLLFERLLCVPTDSAVKTELLTDAHSSPFSMHPEFVSKCLVCQQVKAPMQKLVGLLQPLSVAEWKWENESMDFITGLPRTLRGFTVIWVIVDRLTKSAYFIPGKSTYTASKWAQLYMSEITDGQTERLNKVLEDMLRACALEFPDPVYWDEVGEQRMVGPELVQSTNKAIQKIRSRMQTTQSRQKSYADVRRKDLEFDVGDKVFLKVAPMKGVLRFERRRKLSPRFIGSSEILERIGPVAYRLALPPSLLAVHDVFHVSMLRKYVPDLSHVVDYKPLEIDENLSYTEQPVEVLAREVKMLRNRKIPLVKVLWRNHRVEEATWEREDDIRACVTEVTLRFWGVTTSVVGANSPLFGWIRLDVELNKNFSYSSGKGFLTTGPQTEVRNLKSVVGALVMELCRGGTKRSKTSCVDVLGFELRRNTVRRFSMDCGVTVSFTYGVAYLTGTVSFGIPRLICVSFEIARLICASFEITRLICKGMARSRPMKGKKDA